MTLYKAPINLGAPDPELRNSPIISNINDEREMIEPEIPEERGCYIRHANACGCYLGLNAQL